MRRPRLCQRCLFPSIAGVLVVFASMRMAKSIAEGYSARKKGKLPAPFAAGPSRTEIPQLQLLATWLSAIAQEGVEIVAER